MQTSIVSWIVFLVTLVLVLTSLISVVFPALLLRTFGGLEDNSGINPYEMGIWALPLLATNLILLGIGVLYFTNKIPKTISKSIKFIFDFEVSAKIALIVIVVIIGAYIASSIGELFNGKFDDDYYQFVKSYIDNYSIMHLSNWGLGHHLTLFLLSSSLKVFGNYKVIPYISSIALLVLTYLTAVEISKKRFAGIVAMVIVLQSGIFLMYDTSVAYPSFWILFYLLSLYLIYKKWHLSPLVYVSSILSKGLTAAFLPMTLFFIYRSNISKQKKLRLVTVYSVLAIIGTVILYITGKSLNTEQYHAFSSHSFWAGFSAVSTSLRLDGLVLLFILPLTIGLFVASRNEVKCADSILFLITGLLLSAPLLPAFSDLANFPYRFVALTVFFALGVSVLLSKKINEPS